MNDSAPVTADIPSNISASLTAAEATARLADVIAAVETQFLGRRAAIEMAGGGRGERERRAQAGRSSSS